MRCGVNRMITCFALILALLYTLFIICFVVMLILSRHSDYEYADFLRTRMQLSCGIAITLSLIFVIFGFIFLKRLSDDVVEKWMVVIWFAFSAVIIAFCMACLWTHCADITNEDCITFVGEFEKDHTAQFVFLNDENSTRLTNTSKTYLDTGKYFGKVVYSKRSKYVLSFTLDGE